MNTRLPAWLRRQLAALRALLVFTVLLGLIYPVAVWGVGYLPGLHDRAQGSIVENSAGKQVGSAEIGQSFTDTNGNALPQYFQSRPSKAGDGYDPTSTGASNLGPEDLVDVLPDPAIIKAGKEDENARQSLLTQVCERSKAIGEREGVSGARPYCTPGGVGAVLAVFGTRTPGGNVPHPTRVVSLNEQCSTDPAKPVTPFLRTYKGVAVECARFGEDYAKGKVVPIRGDAPANPRVPTDAVTASGSGLDPHISPAYARLQAPRVARTRGVPVSEVLSAVAHNESGRDLGFMGEPRVNVLELNLELDQKFPYRG